MLAKSTLHVEVSQVDWPSSCLYCNAQPESTCVDSPLRATDDDDEEFLRTIGQFWTVSFSLRTKVSQTLQSVLCITTNKYLVRVLVVLLHARFSVFGPMPFLLAAIFSPVQRWLWTMHNYVQDSGPGQEIAILDICSSLPGYQG